jgi:hypothetical protein
MKTVILILLSLGAFAQIHLKNQYFGQANLGLYDTFKSRSFGLSFGQYTKQLNENSIAAFYSNKRSGNAVAVDMITLNVKHGICLYANPYKTKTMRLNMGLATGIELYNKRKREFESRPLLYTQGIILAPNVGLELELSPIVLYHTQQYNLFSNYQKLSAFTGIAYRYHF